jgi:hypothetical protein
LKEIFKIKSFIKVKIGFYKYVGGSIKQRKKIKTRREKAWLGVAQK